MSKMFSRYQKHLLLKEFGAEDQRRLLNSRVLIIGCGALGSSVSGFLTRAGAGDITIVDRDRIEKGNLQRQLLFDESDVGKPKAEVACKKLRVVNSEIKLTAVTDDITGVNIEEFTEGMDIVIDATDNISTRMIINDACIRNKIPWIYGGVLGTAGMTFNIMPPGPCFRCIIPDIPSSGNIPGCDTLGVINTIPAVVGAIQSTQAIKILTGKKCEKRLIRYDIWSSSYTHVEIEKNNNCECCVKHNFEFLRKSSGESVSLLCDNSIQIVPGEKRVVDLSEIYRNMGKLFKGELNDLMLSFEVEGKKVTLFRNGRMIIRGTEDRGVAKSIYSRFLGI